MEPALAFFGLSETSTVSELRAAYYSMALLCHPDRGGSREQMAFVCTQYEAATRLLTHQDDGQARMHKLEEALQQQQQMTSDNKCSVAVTVDDVTGGYDERGDGSATTVRQVPTFLEIFEETHEEFNLRFNRSFEQQQQQREGETDPYATQGYGDYLATSENHHCSGGGGERKPTGDTSVPDLPPRTIIPFHGVQEWITPEQEALGCPLPQEEEDAASSTSPCIHDFTLCTPRLRMNDYRNAMTTDTTLQDAAAAKTTGDAAWWLSHHMPRRFNVHRVDGTDTTPSLFVRIPEEAADTEDTVNTVVASQRSWMTQFCLHKRDHQDGGDTQVATSAIPPRVTIGKVTRAESGSEVKDADAECASITNTMSSCVESKWDLIIKQQPEYEWLDCMIQEVVGSLLPPPPSPI